MYWKQLQNGELYPTFIWWANPGTYNNLQSDHRPKLSLEDISGLFSLHLFSTQVLKHMQEPFRINLDQEASSRVHQTVNWVHYISKDCNNQNPNDQKTVTIFHWSHNMLYSKIGFTDFELISQRIISSKTFCKQTQLWRHWRFFPTFYWCEKRILNFQWKCSK